MAEFRAFLEGRWDSVPGVIRSDGPCVSSLEYLFRERNIRSADSMSSSRENDYIGEKMVKDSETANEYKARASQALCKSLQLGRDIRVIEDRIIKQREEQQRQASVLQNQLKEIEARKRTLESYYQAIEDNKSKLKEIEARIKECSDILDATAQNEEEANDTTSQKGFENFVAALTSFLSARSHKERKQLAEKIVLPLPQDVITQNSINTLGWLTKVLETSSK